MKTFRNFLFVAVLVLSVFSPKSYALLCEQSQALNGPEECYTKVTVSSIENVLVSQGAALVYNIDATTPKQGSYEVRLPTASVDNAIIAGFAQAPIASGNSALILVRGFGFVRTTGGIASRDMLFVAASGNVAAFTGVATGTYASSEPVAIALETSSTNGSTARRAFVKVM